MEVNTLINKYIDHLENTETKKAYSYALNGYLNFLQKQSLRGTTENDIIKYKEYLIDEGYRIRTVNAYIMAVKSFYRFLSEIGLCKNIGKKIKKEKEPISEKETLTLEQVKKLLNSIDTTDLKGKRNKALLALMFQTGLRCKEINLAKVGDIKRFENYAILFVQGKGHTEKDDYVFLYDHTLGIIDEYLNARKNLNNDCALIAGIGSRSHGALHVKSISHIVKQIFLENGLNSRNLTAHSTRHTACTLAYLYNSDIQSISSMARHKETSTTMMYIHEEKKLNRPEKILDQIYYQERMDIENEKNKRKS